MLQVEERKTAKETIDDGNGRSLVERFPFGISMLFSSFLRAESGGQYGAYKPYQVLELLLPLFDAIRVSQVKVRSSMVTDIVDYARNGMMTRPFLKRIVPFRSWFVLSLEHMSDERREFFSQFIQGSDLDFHVTVEGVEGFVSWVSRISEQITSSFLHNERNHVTQSDHSIEIVVNQSLLQAWYRNDVRRHWSIVPGDMLATPVIRITWGCWDNGIPFCDLLTLARFSEDKRDTTKDVVLCSLGFSASKESLPPELAQLNTRMDPKANSWDTKAFAQLFCTGSGDDREAYDHEVGKIPAIYVPPESLAVLDSEMHFGEAFGTADPGETFDELLRVLRKTIQYQDSSTIENSFCSIHRTWQQVNYDGRLAKKICEYMQTNTSRKHACMRELLTMAFYAPKELAIIGSMLQFQQCIPRWGEYADLAWQCPTKEQMQEFLVRDADPWQYGESGESGWSLLIKAGSAAGYIKRNWRIDQSQAKHERPFSVVQEEPDCSSQPRLLHALKVFRRKRLVPKFQEHASNTALDYLYEILEIGPARI